jgi:uncharacterized protein
MTTHLWLTLVLAVLTGMALSRANMCFMYAAKSTAEGRLQPLVNVLLTVAAATVVFAICGHAGLRGPAPWAWPGALTVLGGVLFGVGARINGSCTIGTMGRLAHGDVGALATFAGGGFAIALLPHHNPAGDPPPWVASVELYWVAAVVIIAAAGVAILLRRREKVERAAEVILLGGFAALLYALRGQSSLMDAAGTMMAEGRSMLPALIALAGLLIGAVGVAMATGRFRLSLQHPRRIPLELLGGALMTTGALCIPGASDVVAFYGLPSGSPHAVVAWLLILGTVILSFRLTNSDRWRARFAPTAA